MKYAKHTLRNAKHEPSRGFGGMPMNLVQIWTKNLLEINLSKSSYLLHFSKLVVSIVIVVFTIILCDVFLQ